MSVLSRKWDLEPLRAISADRWGGRGAQATPDVCAVRGADTTPWGDGDPTRCMEGVSGAFYWAALQPLTAPSYGRMRQSPSLLLDSNQVTNWALTVGARLLSARERSATVEAWSSFGRL